MRIIACVTLPDIIITRNVVIIVIEMYESHTDESTSHDSSKPTADGINISGIISMRKLEVSLMCSTFKNPVQRLKNNSIIPYMLLGIGSGMRKCKISPTKENAIMIKNCLMYFIFVI